MSDRIYDVQDGQPTLRAPTPRELAEPASSAIGINWEKLAKERGEGEVQARSENARLRDALERIAVFYRGGERATESMLEMRAIAKSALCSPNACLSHGDGSATPTTR